MIQFSRIKKIHFVGIGGSGMSGIAEVLHNMGFIVSGSDISENETVKRFKAMGLKIFKGHYKENVDGIETLVYSSAVTHENPEVEAAANNKIPVIPRAEMLAELMRVKYSIAVAGTHGKTTTTSMMAAIMTAAKKDPTYVVGGKLKIPGTPLTSTGIPGGSRLGKSDYLVAEADESDGSFLKLFPTLAIITNIENDHLDYYRTMDNLREAFQQFGDRVPFYGSVIINSQCEESRALVPGFNKRVITYSLSHDSDIKAVNIKNTVFNTAFDVIESGGNLGTFQLNTGGIHNILNALAAIAAALEIGIKVSDIKEGLKHFLMPDRRFQVLYAKNNMLVIDDYAHHPTEVRVTLDTLLTGNFKRIIAVFQPHRYSRLELLIDQFGGTFDGIQQLIIAPIYTANQARINNVDSSVLAGKIKASGFDAVQYIDSHNGILAYLEKEIRSGDAVVFLSAGNLSQTAHGFKKLLEERV